MAFRGVLANAGVLDLSSSIRQDGKRYVAYTCYADSKSALQLSATDGLRMWSKEYDETALQKCREASSLSTLDSLLVDMKAAFQNGGVKLNILPQQVHLSLHSGIELELSESTVHTSRLQIQELVLLLAGKADSVGAELVVAKRKITELEQQCHDASTISTSASSSAMYEPELKKKNLGPKLKRQQGRSILNPSSRKRKAASGVVFEED